MIRALKYIILLILVLLLCGGIFVGYLLTDNGNAFVKPYVEKYLRYKSGFDVRFDKFNIKINYIDIVAVVNGEIELASKGNYSLFSQNLNLKYQLNVNGLKSFNLNLKEPLSVGGGINGKFKEFVLDGNGAMFNSNLNYRAKVVDFGVVDANLEGREFDIAKMQKVFDIDKYLDGKLTIKADIKDGSGTALIATKEAQIDKASLKKLGITPPDKTDFILNSGIKIDGDKIAAKTKIASDLLNLEANRTNYDIASSSLTSDLTLYIADLEKLEPLIGKKFVGALKVGANIVIKENKPQFIEAVIKGFGGEILANLKDENLDVEIKSIELINLLSNPSLGSAKLDGVANISKIYDSKNMQGSINLFIDNGTINKDELKKLTDFALLENFDFKLANKTLINSGKITSTSGIFSNLFNTKTMDVTYDIAKERADLDFELIVPQISKISPNITSNSSLNAKGKATLIESELKNLDALISTLDGSVALNSDGKKLAASIKNIEISELLALIAQPIYSSGKINGEIKLSSIDTKELSGDGTINVAGVLNKPVLDKILEKEFPTNVGFNGNFTFNIKNQIANFKSKLNSDLANLTKLDGNFNIANSILEATYQLYIPSLSKLEFMAGTKLNGDFKADGDLLFKKDSSLLNLYSDFLDGKLVANLKNNILKANFNGFSTEKISDLLVMDRIYKGVGTADLDYDILKKSGKFNANIKDGALVANNFTNLIRATTGFDIANEVYKDTKIDGTIKQEMINFNANMQASRSKISVTNGKLNTKTKALNIPVISNFEKTDINVLITGTTQKPKYKISSNYLKQKLDDAVTKQVGKLLGSGNKNKDDGKDSSNSNVEKLIDKGLGKLFGK
ncbi:hypothetical protein [uncultured Campylobacter sp.]|uniref:hypothetical protein n=1 Tax=uncultured Campylobacter sp. TaxID=218934 RepID=UPI0026119B7D|nr:hypothetical protein [uncultured Campylobacter sp.]